MPKQSARISSNFSPSSSPYYSSSYGSKSPSPLLFYGMLVLLIASFGISIYAVASIHQIKKAVYPQTINTQDFLKKVTGNAGLENYKDVPPVNIVQISSNNLAALQGQIQGLNVNHIGKFLIQYPDIIVLYDYATNKIEAQLSIQQQPQFTQDFFAKLYAHPEVSALSDSTPVGGVLDKASLDQLTQQFPDVYKHAKVGDILLRYPTALVIYDSYQDKIINKVDLTQAATLKE